MFYYFKYQVIIMEYTKLIVNLPKEEKEIIVRVCSLDKRTMASLVRKVLADYCKEFLGVKNEQS